MRMQIFILQLAITIFACPRLVVTSQAEVYRVGVIHQGGAYLASVEGLRDGLRRLGFDEEKHYILRIRDAGGDLKLVEESARNFEREKVHLIYTLAGSVTNAVKKVTRNTSIVFCVGSDPVVLGLVESIARPGGRLTGIHFLLTDLTEKRLELLKEVVPKLSRVVTFYNPSNRGAKEAVRLAGEAAKTLKILIVERHIVSVDELRQELQKIQPGEVDAYFFTSDAMVASHAHLIIEMAMARKLPTIFHESSLVVQGGLASYGLSFYETGRMSARYVHRVLTGTHPQDLPIERAHKFEFVINMKTAKLLNLTIPPNILARADKVIK